MGFTKEEIFSPHQLRHSFATRQTKLGVDLLTLKELLGHAEVATTFNYSTPGSEHLEKKSKDGSRKVAKSIIQL